MRHFGGAVPCVSSSGLTPLGSEPGDTTSTRSENTVIRVGSAISKFLWASALTIASCSARGEYLRALGVVRSALSKATQDCSRKQRGGTKAFANAERVATTSSVSATFSFHSTCSLSLMESVSDRSGLSCGQSIRTERAVAASANWLMNLTATASDLANSLAVAANPGVRQNLPFVQRPLPLHFGHSTTRLPWQMGQAMRHEYSSPRAQIDLACHVGPTSAQTSPAGPPARP